MVSTSSLFILCLSRDLHFTICSFKHKKEKWDLIQWKERAEMLLVWTAVGSSSVTSVNVVVSALTFVWYVTASKNSLSIHAETHGHDWLLLSEEPSRDAHRLKGLRVSASARSCVSRWHFDRPISVTDWTKFRITSEDTPREICIDLTKLTMLTRLFYFVSLSRFPCVLFIKKFIMCLDRFFLSHFGFGGSFTFLRNTYLRGLSVLLIGPLIA